VDLTGIAVRVLVKEVNWLGDLVISLPALRAIRAEFATATLTVMVKNELASFFDGMTWVDEVMPYTVARGVRGIADRMAIVGRIRARRFDLAILFPNSFASALWTTLGGARQRAGFMTDYRSGLLTHRARPAGEALTGHQRDYWLAMIRETIGVMPVAGAAEMKLEVAGSHLEKMRSWLKAKRKSPGVPLIAIAPAAAYGPA
jgi:heptosyltransferase II